MAPKRNVRYRSSETSEMYLETILILREEKDGVHAVDIARALDFSKPTVSEYLHRLRDEDLVSIDENSHVSLTEKGEKIAQTIYERHQVLSAVLMHIGVSEETAIEDACRIEHYISAETFDRIKEFCCKGEGEN